MPETENGADGGKQPAPKAIADLVARFQEQLDVYKSGRYNEAQLRQEFLNPFFKALGWDVQNELGSAQAYKDVIHEDTIRIGGVVKAPDYCFRIGGARKFFLEAKKPAVNIKDEISAAYQVRRYAWSAKLPLSILSDFEEFAVYDCRIKPDKDDPASTARIFYCTFQEYAENWDWISERFSQGAVRRGSLEKFAASIRAKRGTSEVDAAFLEEIESWRAEMARNLALRNDRLTQRELNFAVQRIIDRIVFLRICEDRGIEDYGRLRSVASGKEVYANLCKLFLAADARYNSGLFHFKKERDRHEDCDDLTLTLQLDDTQLSKILRGLYYPESPYAFSVLSADILGQVYEQFLGKVIRLTDAHKAVVDDKPEVKKAGGVYYTPTYVVDYIVRRTIGSLVEGKTPKQVEKLRVLDPACGSGSFLIAAYQFLLDWHLAWYLKNDPEKHTRGSKPALSQTNTGSKLTIDSRKRILLNNIFGVDIDTQAVEVTKLSLLLKVLEGETEQSVQTIFNLFQERALPDLGENIKCGNSLVGPDLYDQQTTNMDSDARYRINVFSWKTEFAETFKAGGFDAVIGNPPYIFTRELIPVLEREYFAKNFAMSWEKQNTFMLFMELLLRLVKESGRAGFIVPNSWLTIESGKLLRENYIRRLLLVADLNYAVFERVAMEPCIFVIAGKDVKTDVDVVRAGSRDAFSSSVPVTMKRLAWAENGGRIILAASGAVMDVMKMITKDCVCLEERFDVKTGLQAYERGRGIPPQTAKDVRDHIFDRDKREDKNSIKYLEGRDVGRYLVSWSGMWMQYGHWLSQPRELGMFSRPRVLLREITAPLPHCLFAAFTDETLLNNKSILNVLHEDDSEDQLKALTCILNSRFMSVYYKTHAVKGARTLFPKVVIKNLREFPFPKTINPVVLKKLVASFDATMSLGAQNAAARTPQEQTALLRQVVAADAKTDHLVYAMFGLSEDDIMVVDAAASVPSATEAAKLAADARAADQP